MHLTRLIEQMEVTSVAVVILFKPQFAALCQHPVQNEIYLN